MDPRKIINHLLCTENKKTTERETEIKNSRHSQHENMQENKANIVKWTTE